MKSLADVFDDYTGVRGAVVQFPVLLGRAPADGQPEAIAHRRQRTYTPYVMNPASINEPGDFAFAGLMSADIPPAAQGRKLTISTFARPPLLCNRLTCYTKVLCNYC